MATTARTVVSVATAATAPRSDVMLVEEAAFVPLAALEAEFELPRRSSRVRVITTTTGATAARTAARSATSTIAPKTTNRTTTELTTANRTTTTTTTTTVSRMISPETFPTDAVSSAEETAVTTTTATTTSPAARSDVMLDEEVAFDADISGAALEAESVPLRRSSRVRVITTTVYHEAAAKKKSDDAEKKDGWTNEEALVALIGNRALHVSVVLDDEDVDDNDKIPFITFCKAKDKWVSIICLFLFVY